jgi:recombination protein RecA
MITDLVAKLYSKYKDEIILGTGEDENFALKVIPTNLIGLDYVIGRPGIPAWRITQIAGFEDSGKSLLAQWLMIQFQKEVSKGVVIYINTEYSFDSDFFVKLGGDLSNLIIASPDTLEKVFGFIEDSIMLIREQFGKDIHVLCVIDSLSASVEAEVKRGESQPGLHARYLSFIFRKIKSKLYSWNATLVYISQNKEKISLTPFGGGIARLGGHAVEFAPVLTLDIKRLKEEKGEEIKYLTFKVKATKNHIAVPFREVELLFDLETFSFRNGYNLLKFLMALGEITKEKGWYRYQGKSYRESDLIQELEYNTEVEEEVRELLKINKNKEVLLS